MERIGKPIVFNICMLGALIGLTRMVRSSSIMNVLQTRIPENFLNLNREALHLGMELIQSLD
jgi:2-oxoglutarate ferredoxin oxidoreductase subunit gamma